MKKFLLILAVFVLFGYAEPADARHKNTPPVYVDQQMILMGLYVYGINQELTKTVPDLDELQFLAESIEEIALRTQTAKRGRVFHKNLSELLQEARKLKMLSRKNRLKEAMEQAKILTQSCAKCHKSGG